MILGIDHVGVVVSNLGKARSRFAAILGRESGPSELVESHGVHVAFAPHGWQVASAAALEIGSLIGAPQVGADVLSDGTRLEFLEPVDEASAVGRFMARRGEGLHHVCFVTDDIGAELARAGDRRAWARVLTSVETGSPSGGTLVHNARQALLGTGIVAKRTRVIGITGAPGAGKSTLVGALARSMRRADPDHRIAVLAIDPSNPFTRGALLGDRIRMPEASGDDGIFIRSVAGRGSGDGLSRSAGEMLAVLQYVGFDTVLLETVGAGQDELAVGALAWALRRALEAPSDGIQALKAGLLDLAQIVVVNKADLDGAAGLASQLAFGRNDSVTIVATNSTTGSGIDELREAIAQCANATGPVQSSRHQLVTSSIVQLAVDQFRASLLGAIDGNPLWADTIGQVERREMSVDEAARRFLAGVLKAEI